MKNIFFHVYVSSAVSLMRPEELLALLDRCRTNNAKLGLTGMLLHKDGNFMQVLEGPELRVKALLEKIHLDPRHRGVIQLLEGSSEARQFAEWSMGFRDLNSPEVRSAPGYNEFMNLSLTADSFGSDPTACQRLLQSFRKTQR